MENQPVIELSEAELDEVFGGISISPVCDQTPLRGCAAECCIDNV